MHKVPSISIPFWRKWLAKINLYALRSRDEATTIVVEVDNATGAIHINKIQDIPMETAIEIFKRIIKLSN